MTVAVGTQYQQLCEAVKNYYGAGSDQWLEIAQYGVGASDFKNIVSQVPGVNVTVAKDGTVLGYSLNEVASTGAPGQTVAEFLNSNTMGGTNSAANSASVNIPASTGIASGGTAATAKSGVSRVYQAGQAVATGAKFVTGEVLPAVMAAATGISLGKTIDSFLYNANPEFWDNNGMSTLNPETWNSITTDYDGPGVLKSAFNTIFGLDPESGKMQMYADENALAYMALYLANAGVFSTGSEYEQKGSVTLPSGQYENSVSQPIHVSDSAVQTTGTRLFDWTCSSDAHMILIEGSTYYTIAAFSRSSGQTATRTRQGGGGSPLVYNLDSTMSYQGETYYYKLISGGSNPLTDYTGLTANSNVYQTNNNVNTNILKIYAYIFYNGTFVKGGGVDGIGDQSGATQPTGTNNWTTPADTKTSLQTQYPDLWDNRIEQDVLQPDGTIKTITYVPVPMPDGVNTNQPANTQQPTSSGTTSTQTSPEVNPNNTTDSMLQTVIDILTSPTSTPSGQTTPQTSPQSDSETPLNPNEQTPDTGSGTSPTVIVPTGGASALWSVYNPSQANVNALGAWLWSSNFIDQLLKLFSDPMQAIIGLHKIFATPAISGTGNIVVGYLDSGVSANLVSNQYTTVDCGSVNCFEYFGNVFDYSPHTRIHLYLPFIGIVELNCADVMRGVVSVRYTVDVITGACLAEVSISRDASGGVLYTYSGDCAVRYPVSSGSYMSIVGGILSIAGGIAATVASGGAAAPAVLGAAAGLGRMHTDVKHSGNLSGNAGAMGIKKPYLIISRPQSATAADFNKYQGIGANAKKSVGDMSGYFKMDDVRLTGVAGATKEELEEIRVLLKTGVIK